MVKQKTYFWLCSYPLAPGSVVEPGNWGRFLRLYQFNDFQRVCRLLEEEIFERVRISNYSDRPSRYKCNFLCEDYNQIVKFRDVAGRSRDLIFEVQIVERNTLLFKTDWSLIGVSQNDTLPIIEKKAHKYWQGKEIIDPEILTTSKIKILRRHD